MYVMYADDIFRFLFVHVRDDALAKDLTAETFLRAWKNIDTFDFKQSRAWLYKIAQNAMTDHWRKKRPMLLDETEEVIDDEANSIEEDVDKKLAGEKLMAAVEQLPSDMKSVVTLRFMNGLSAKQAAESLGTTEGNIRIKQFRALKRLKELLA